MTFPRVVRRTGLAEALRQVEQRLVREVERALEAQAARVREPRAALEVREVVAHRERRRGQDPRARLCLHQRRELRCDVHRRVVAAHAARARLRPAHAALELLARERVQALGAFHQSLAQACKRALPLARKRCECLRELGGTTRKSVQRLHQAFGPLRMLEPRVGTTAGGHHRGDLRIEPGERRIDAGGHLLREQQLAGNVLGNRRQLARADVVAEELRGHVRQLVRLVDDDRVGAGQQVAEALLLQHEVGHQQVVIHDDDVGGLGLAPRREHEAVVVLRAFGAETVLARRGDPRPDGILLADAAAIRRCPRGGSRATTRGPSEWPRPPRAARHARRPAAPPCRADGGTGSWRGPSAVRSGPDGPVPRRRLECRGDRAGPAARACPSRGSRAAPKRAPARGRRMSCRCPFRPRRPVSRGPSVPLRRARPSPTARSRTP